MRYTLGKITLFLLILSTSLLADSQLAVYTLSSNKSSAVLKEPVVITFTAHQKDHADHMFFTLQPKKSDAYDIKLLEKVTHDKQYHDTSVTFTYLLFPLEVKTLHVGFDFTIKTASDKAIKQSYVDDHDDSVAISTIDTKIAIKPLEIAVQSLEHTVDLVGDFTLTSSADKKKITPFEDLNLHYILSGKGYRADQLHLIDKANQPITLFSEVHVDHNRLTKQGYDIKKEYIYAITAKQDFTIPAVHLSAYSPKKQKYYTLDIPKKKIQVEKIDTAKLLDKETFPQEAEIDWNFYKNIAIALIIFIAGFVTAKLSEKVTLGKKKKDDPYKEIKEAASAHALILLLMQKYDHAQVKTFIDELDSAAYKDKDASLKAIKARIIKALT